MIFQHTSLKVLVLRGVRAEREHLANHYSRQLARQLYYSRKRRQPEEESSRIQHHHEQDCTSLNIPLPKACCQTEPINHPRPPDSSFPNAINSEYNSRSGPAQRLCCGCLWHSGQCIESPSSSGAFLFLFLFVLIPVLGRSVVLKSLKNGIWNMNINGQHAMK